MGTLLLVLDLVGTFVFALSGAMAGVKHRLDLFALQRGSPSRPAHLGRRALIVCQTLDEFIAKSTGYEMRAAA